MSHDSLFFLTAYEVADYFRISRPCAYYLLHTGEIPGFKVGYYWRIPTSALNEYVANKLEQQKIKSQNDSVSNIQ